MITAIIVGMYLASAFILGFPIYVARRKSRIAYYRLQMTEYLCNLEKEAMKGNIRSNGVLHDEFMQFMREVVYTKKESFYSNMLLLGREDAKVKIENLVHELFEDPDTLFPNFINFCASYFSIYRIYYPIQSRKIVHHIKQRDKVSRQKALEKASENIVYQSFNDKRQNLKLATA